MRRNAEFRFRADVPSRRSASPKPGAPHPRLWARVAVLAGLVGFHAVAGAACPVGDPAVLYCEDFAAANPLSNYTIVSPEGGTTSFAIGIGNSALIFQNVNDGLAFASVISLFPLNYRNTLFEADLRFDTTNPGLRSAMGIKWAGSTINPPPTDTRIQLAFQLDERQFNFYAAAGGWTAERRIYWPSLQPNQTYRVGFRIAEVPGPVPNGPKMLSFKGYIDGVLVLSETEQSLGVNLLAMPAQLSPSFHGGSYSWSPVQQVFDNAIVRKDLRLACTGFEAPLNKGAVVISKHRVLPFKARLTDEQGTVIKALGAFPPLIRVVYTPATGPSVDVSEYAMPAGQGTTAHEFVFADDLWQFNLQTHPYAAAGTYRVTMKPGSDYTIDGNCSGSFVLK